jgi:hypothetical protein
MSRLGVRSTLAAFIIVNAGPLDRVRFRHDHEHTGS